MDPRDDCEYRLRVGVSGFSMLGKNKFHWDTQGRWLVHSDNGI